MAETKRVTDKVKGLFTKSVQGEMQLFNRFSTLTAEVARDFFAGTTRKSLPSISEGLTRAVEFNLACWSAAADHGLAFANELAGACEKALGVTAPTTKASGRKKRSTRKARS